MATYSKSAIPIALLMENYLNTQNKTQLDRFTEEARQLETDDEASDD
jgi:hypothetical protein